MSKLHQILYQTYLQAMHQFCQYPALPAELEAIELSSKVHVLAIGKAAWKMASIAVKSLHGRDIDYDGFVLTKYSLTYGEIPGITIFEAGHPLPDANSLHYSKEILRWLREIPCGEDLIVLISGGSSALFEALPDSLSLSELQIINNDLLRSGAPIGTINAQRIEISLVKGGKALAMCKSRHCYIFALSDVAGNDPHVIGSAPFTPMIPGRQSGSVHNFDLEDKTVVYSILADNHTFCSLVAESLRSNGFQVSLDDVYHRWSTPRFASELREILRKAYSPRYRKHLPRLIVMGGENPVKVNGTGSGGRCSHLALSVASAISKHPNTAFFCLATDGSDNLPGNGGAFVDTNSRNLLKNTGYTITKTLAECDSYTSLSAIQHILPAPLLPTNVNDVFILSLGYDFDEPFPTGTDDTCDIFEGSY